MPFTDALPENLLPNPSGLGNAVQKIGTTVLIIVLVAGVCLALFFYLRNWLRYKQFKCVIFQKDGLGNTVETTDDAGIFYDKNTRQKLLRLKKSKISLDPDKINYHFTQKQKIIYFLKYGTKELRPLHFNISNPDFTYQVGEVDLNWMLDEYHRNTQMFKVQSLLMQMLPYVVIAITVFGCLMAMYFLFQKADVIQGAAEAFKETSKNLLAYKSNSTVIQT